MAALSAAGVWGRLAARVLRGQGEYRVVGEQVWARNAAGMRFLPREKHLDDVVVARRVLHLLDHGM
jgi:hypothetical protein